MSARAEKGGGIFQVSSSRHAKIDSTAKTKKRFFDFSESRFPAIFVATFRQKPIFATEPGKPGLSYSLAAVR